jgi:hypothetical protein
MIAMLRTSSGLLHTCTGELLGGLRRRVQGHPNLAHTGVDVRRLTAKHTAVYVSPTHTYTHTDMHTHMHMLTPMHPAHMPMCDRHPRTPAPHLMSVVRNSLL